MSEGGRDEAIHQDKKGRMKIEKMSEGLKKKRGSTKAMQGLCIVERTDGVEVSRGVIPLPVWENKRHVRFMTSCPYDMLSAPGCYSAKENDHKPTVKQRTREV